MESENKFIHNEALVKCVNHKENVNRKIAHLNDVGFLRS